MIRAQGVPIPPQDPKLKVPSVAFVESRHIDKASPDMVAAFAAVEKRLKSLEARVALLESAKVPAPAALSAKSVPNGTTAGGAGDLSDANEPWKAAGVSRRTWFREQAKRRQSS